MDFEFETFCRIRNYRCTLAYTIVSIQRLMPQEILLFYLILPVIRLWQPMNLQETLVTSEQETEDTPTNARSGASCKLS